MKSSESGDKPSRAEGCIWTVGHSTLSGEGFTDLLCAYRICRLVDVRSYPSSRRHPQFNQDSLEALLDSKGIDYRHMPSLGGLRRSGLQSSPNAGWGEKGFQNYADHMLSREFGLALEELTRIAGTRPTAIMCAEASPWRCHRQLISDALCGLQAFEVRHILSPERWESHRLTSFARLQNGQILYPAPQGKLFE